MPETVPGFHQTKEEIVVHRVIEGTWLEEAKKNAGFLIFLGILTVVFGVLAIGAPLMTGVAVAWLVGLSGLPSAHRPITDVLAEVLAVLLLVGGGVFAASSLQGDAGGDDTTTTASRRGWRSSDTTGRRPPRWAWPAMAR